MPEGRVVKGTDDDDEGDGLAGTRKTRSRYKEFSGVTAAIEEQYFISMPLRWGGGRQQLIINHHHHHPLNSRK